MTHTGPHGGFLRIGLRDLRFIHAAGVCVLIRPRSGGGVETLAVVQSDDLARDARQGRDWVVRAARRGAAEALVLLERSEIVRERLAHALLAGVLPTPSAPRP